MKQAAAYLRRSTDRQEQSIADQRKAILTYASDHGFDVMRSYVDDAVSGTSTNGRKGFERMMADSAQDGCQFRYVLVYDVKRFSRGDNDEAGHYRYLLRERGIEVIYVSENFSGNDTDDLVCSVKQWQARQESKDLSKVTFRGLLSKAEQGYWLGGVPPFGYDLKYESGEGTPLMTVRFLNDGRKEVYDPKGKLTRVLPRKDRVVVAKKDRARLVLGDPGRVELVKRIYHMYTREGMGLRSIVQRLNEQETASPRNGYWSERTRPFWSIATVYSILRNPLYTGQMVWNRRAMGKFHLVQAGQARERTRSELRKLRVTSEDDWIVVPDTHPAIIDKPTFEAAQRLLRERGLTHHTAKEYRSGRARNSPYLLSGIMKCARCGHSYQGYTTGKVKCRETGEKVRTRCYACSGYVTKGNAVCARNLVGLTAVEDYVLERIRLRIDRFLGEDGKKKLRETIANELGPDRAEPKRELKRIRERLAKIEADVDRLLDSLTPVNKEFVDRKLPKLGEERKRFEERVRQLEVMPHAHVEPAELAKQIVQRLTGFKELFEQGTLEERKEFVRAFVQKLVIDPDNGKGVLYIRRFPVLGAMRTEDGSLVFVAGARYIHQKKIFPAIEPPVKVEEIALTYRGSVLIPA